MGKVVASTESMDHIVSVVSNYSVNYSAESDRIEKTITSIQERANKSLKNSDRLIHSYQTDIDELRSKIRYYISIRNQYNNYQHEIDTCNQSINSIRKRMMAEQSKNDELKRSISLFRQQSIQVLSSLKSVLRVIEEANTEGKQYIQKKTSILLQHYDKFSAIAASGGISSVMGAIMGSPSGNLGMSSASAELSVHDFKSNLDAAHDWGESAFSQWNDSLSIVERQALADYKKELIPHSSSYYVNINETLRSPTDNGVSFRDGNEMRYIRIHQALSRSIVPEDVIAYRGLSQDAFASMQNSAQAFGQEQGLYDSGFMSCSLYAESPFVLSNNVIMRVTIPEGTRGAFIGNIGQPMRTECELLLDCGSSIFALDTYQAPRSEITGNPLDTEIITIVDCVVET